MRHVAEEGAVKSIGDVPAVGQQMKATMGGLQSMEIAVAPLAGQSDVVPNRPVGALSAERGGSPSSSRAAPWAATSDIRRPMLQHGQHLRGAVKGPR